MRKFVAHILIVCFIMTAVPLNAISEDALIERIEKLEEQVAFLLTLIDVQIPAEDAQAPIEDAQTQEISVSNRTYTSSDGKWTVNARYMHAILNGQVYTDLYPTYVPKTRRVYIELPENTELAIGFNALVEPGKTYSLRDLGSSGSRMVQLTYSDPSYKKNAYGTDEVFDTLFREKYIDKISKFELCIDHYDAQAGVICVYLNLQSEYINIEGYLAAIFSPASGSNTSGNTSRSTFTNNKTLEDTSTTISNPIEDFYIPCKSCGGTGKCSSCNGRKTTSLYGVTVNCGACDGTGICTVCFARK